MAGLIDVQVEGRLAKVFINNPPVNALSRQV